MVAHVASTNRLITTEREADAARGVLEKLEGPDGSLRVDQSGEVQEPIPHDIGRLLQEVLEVVANGGTVTIASTPEELTTSSAAAVLGISRPTLLKMAREGKIPSHRVGSHTRFMAKDVFEERRARRARERAAFEALRDLEDDEV